MLSGEDLIYNYKLALDREIHIVSQRVRLTLYNCHDQTLSDKVDETGVLGPSSEALFGKEICDLIVGLEAACPGYMVRILLASWWGRLQTVYS